MRAVFLSIVLACTLGQPLLVRAQDSAAEGPGASAPAKTKGLGGKKGVNEPSTLVTTTITAAAPSSTSAASTSSIPTSNPPTSSVIISTRTNTIAVSSFMTSSSSISSIGASITPATVPSYSGDASQISATASPLSRQTSNSHRTLIIVLSTVLGSVAIFLVAAVVFLAYRFGQGRRPFGHRGATPINDDEIESWRGTVTEQKQQPQPSPPPPPVVNPMMLDQNSDSIALTHSPGWTWTGSPMSLHSTFSPSATIPDTPSFLAKAPNARAGLTDETVPGADPFITPMKRQSSRLSKAPPGHSRSKSRRSSTSAKSVWSYNGGVGLTESKTNNKRPTWIDSEDRVVGMEFSRTEETISSPGTSMFDGMPPGGLSPRPKSQLRPLERDSEIGRAIT